MNKLKNAALWLLLLSKRLYRRPAFVVLLLVIPALTLGYTTIDTEDSGMMTVAVAQEGLNRPADDLMTDLKTDSQLLRYRLCASPEEAEALVAGGKVDCAWIFPRDVDAGIRQFVENPNDRPFIRVLVREDSVMLRLSRERLSGTTFPKIAQQVYLRFLRKLAPELDALSDQALIDRYNQVDIANHLFAFDESFAQAMDTHYLLSPLRGLLGLLILLCAVATAMYHLRDQQAGTFCRLGQRWRWTAELAGQLVTTLHLTAAVAVCLGLAGLAAPMGQELALTLLYAVCCAAFAMALRRLVGSLRTLAALLPALAVLTLVLCPVFFDLNPLPGLQFLFPPTYYVYAAHQPGYLWHTAAYTLMCFGAYTLLGCLGRDKEP